MRARNSCFYLTYQLPEYLQITQVYDDSQRGWAKDSSVKYDYKYVIIDKSSRMKKVENMESATQSSISVGEQESRIQLPQQIASDMEFIFGFNVTTSQIISLFESVVEEMKFDLIECEQTHATAIKHGKKNIMQMIDCFNWWTEGSVTAIKININTREKDSKRVCRIRGLVGSKKQVVEFISKFRNKCSSLTHTKMMVEQDEVEMGEQQTNPFYLQSCAAYMFHKILANEKYGIGNLLHSSINNFNSEYSDPKGSVQLLPLPMKKAVTIVEEVVSNLYKDFNYGRHQMQQIMPYCRISVEKYLFQKIYPTIATIYQSKNEAVVRSYTAKRTKILATYTPLSIFKEIGLAEKLWISKPDDPELTKPGTFLTSRAAQCYRKAGKELDKITGTQSPREKVKYCQIMYTCLKTTVFEETPGHQQLFNMEDIIPLLIFIILQSGITSIKNELDFMVDFIGFDPCDLESERRLLVNMSESFNYISRDWKVQ